MNINSIRITFNSDKYHYYYYSLVILFNLYVTSILILKHVWFTCIYYICYRVSHVNLFSDYTHDTIDIYNIYLYWPVHLIIKMSCLNMNYIKKTCILYGAAHSSRLMLISQAKPSARSKRPSPSTNDNHTRPRASSIPSRATA